METLGPKGGPSADPLGHELETAEERYSRLRREIIAAGGDPLDDEALEKEIRERKSGAWNTSPDLRGAKAEGLLFQQNPARTPDKIVAVASQESATRWISQSPWAALVDRHSTKLAVAVVMVAISAFLVTQASLEIARTRKDELGVCVQTGGSYVNGNCINTQQRPQ